uniref:Uncharacterized protein n=1 Tax=Candidatus Kentrum sp. DK TaxID=2126562 RepID=A0A450TMP7_9GAMM|nr:MAG: hypothetical protein BECKDK2373B_GA0170837_12305 [Candidatus Kentron sp. DK]
MTPVTSPPPSQLIGNRCGHDPSCSRVFAPPVEHKPRPPILKRITERLSGYFQRPNLIPSLNAVNGSSRRQRSERREACILVMDVLIHYLDLVKLIVGIPQEDGGIRGITMERIAELAGLGVTSRLIREKPFRPISGETKSRSRPINKGN